MKLLPTSFSTKRARQVQQSLVNQVIETDDFTIPPQCICGLDVSYLGQTAIGAAVLLSFPELKLLEEKIVVSQTIVPYIPTFLSFREYTSLSLAYEALSYPPDLCFIDAHGRAHPRRLGAASHFGVLKEIPSIGVAKRLLCGEIKSDTESFDKIVLNNEVVGARILSKPRCNPIYVSVGHRISLKTAVDMTLKCVTKYRLPEPTRRAHKLATKARMEMKKNR
jgi:deoxyribonuclease V